MKSVLISIKPKWCELIASGKKTIEVRKTRPKIETPFKCFIYCTLGGGIKGDVLLKDGHARKVVCGMVIGEFVCDKIYDKEPHYDTPNFCDQYVCGWKDVDADDCLSFSDLNTYLGGKHGYGWHISDLKIYDKPKELSEFWAYNEELHKRYDSEEDFCCYDGTNEYGEALTDCGDAYNNILNCYRCWEEWSGWCHHVTRPPQSWCYVEELQNV